MIAMITAVLIEQIGLSVLISVASGLLVSRPKRVLACSRGSHWPRRKTSR